jgi:hypothetical protein
VRGRLFKTAVLRRSWKRCCGKRPLYGARLPKTKRIVQQNQSRILAQIFLPCRKLQREFSPNDYSEPDGRVLSSGAMVTAAREVQKDYAAESHRNVTPMVRTLMFRTQTVRKTRATTSVRIVIWVGVAGLVVMQGVIYTYGLP